ncbi:Bax inhibitor-1/YccA family protein [Streptomyces sp. RB6PN25]|uniref:Bax inhibitor-1/YccA family protein n=1 Tax=Streptomyces humicola TaxID=2953240 RepID=A0ABT1PS62_9ACTN|nr:Bax inhibitor-1/YccA family protein [Streptomyces humicola]MCQ4080505.1 Bax inhibitor-1/YccA family protein [Streptomyces humicola]
MRSSNPIFSRRGFSRSNEYAGFHQGAPQPGNPYAAHAGAPRDLTADELRAMYRAPAAGPVQTGRMTIDDVVVRTGLTLGTVVVGALLAWFTLPVSGTGYAIAFGSAVVAFVLAVIQAFLRTPMPVLILGYALFEGVFLGVVSNMFNAAWAGAPVQAVLGTMAVFAGMLIAYRSRLIRVTRRYYRAGMAIAIGFVLLMLANLLFAAFGGEGLGLRSGGLGIAFGIVGVLLGAFFLSLDFKMIEDGIRGGAPQKESWLAAFGLTVSLVWIYLEMLRLIAILRD